MSTYNPETGFKIKVGGPTYKRLVREGKIKEARLPSKTSPKRKPGKKSPVKQVDDLYLLREEYHNYRLTAKQIETRLKKQWPDYLYHGKPIMDRHEEIQEEIEATIEEYEGLKKFYADIHPEWSVDKVEKEAADEIDDLVFGQSIDFLWLYDLKSDQFNYYPLNDHWMKIANKKRKDNPALIELYTK